MPLFSIVIVTYQSGEWIGNCLESLKKQTIDDFEVIVLDNASTDDSVERAKQVQLPAVTVVECQKNTGFSGGCNQAASLAKGDWLVFLNPDTIARPCWLEEIAAGQSRYEQVSVFACTQYELNTDEGAEENARLDGVGDAYFGFGIPWRGGFQLPLTSQPEDGECFSPCGASAVIRKDVFERVGGYDERFFCYCEDVDLGFRLRLMGERCVYLSKAAVDHIGSATLGRLSDFNIFHGTRNRMWVYIKNMPIGLLTLTLPGHILLSLAILASSSRRKKFRTTLRGLIAGVRGVPEMWRSRKTIQRSNHVNIARAMCWDFFTMLKRRPHVWPIRRIGD